ncbi:MAG: YkgJ family cysteine cluster protein [Myxococcales bacterium]|nr:YkgJ family cysteine cluster protein [Myxococcales bacterium]MBL0195737.1 YkgJ family cysteine cluster protein [Myxococcales bacterium]
MPLRRDLSDADEADLGDAVVALHAEVERETRHLHVLHASRLQCRSGSASCCVDELTVFEVEAARIRRHHGGLLASGAAHPAGACAFLDAEGACRIYEDRPYVCRTQGLPLRWLEEDEPSAGGAGSEPLHQHELRDNCPKNEPGEALEELREEACWTLGPVETRLAELQVASALPRARTRLRALFGSRG